MSSQQSPVVWFEILVGDLQTAADFYGKLFGWEFEPFVEYDSDYWTIRGDQTGVGGALVLSPHPGRMQSTTIIFMAVENLEESVRRALQLGGAVAKRPKRITKTAGRFAIVNDPEGNSLGLWCR
jgi:hypothetical protein